MHIGSNKILPASPSYPLISVITVCFNAEHTIARTFQGIAEQTYPNIEYIVIDGGSTDNTLSIIEKHKHLITYFVSEQDKGIYDAMNKGVRMAEGVIIGIINADDFYAPNALEQVMGIFQKNKSLDVILGNCSIVNFTEKVVRTGKPHIDFKKGTVSVLHPSVFISKQCYGRYGHFNDTYKYAGDYELFCRLASYNAKFHHIDSTLAYFRLEGFTNRVGMVKERECLLITWKYWGPFTTCRIFPQQLYYFFLRKALVFLRSIGLKKPL